MYIISSPDLVVAVQRNAKTLSSAPFADKYAAWVVDLCEHQILSGSMMLKEQVGREACSMTV